MGLVLMAYGASLLQEPYEMLRRPKPALAMLTPAAQDFDTEELAARFPGLFPLKWPVPTEVARDGAILKTSIDPRLQQEMDALLADRRPAFAAVAAIDPDTGAILALSSYSRERPWRERNLAMVASFPAASVFKIVTAVGAMAEGLRKRQDPMDFVGSRTAMPAAWNTKTTVSRSAHWVTLEEAFAGSINPIFGKIGMHDLGQVGLTNWASRLGWGTPLTTELDVEVSELLMNDSPFATAETGAGYTRNTTISPLHGAALAAIAVNGGRFIRPNVIQSVIDAQGRTRGILRPESELQPILSSEVTDQLIRMMEATVDYGTARNGFAQRNGVLEGLDIGGKTGTLTGDNPPGRCHWFVGWARPTQGGGRPLAFAVLTVQAGRWAGIGTMELTRKLVESYYDHHPEALPPNFWAGVRSRSSHPFGSLAHAAASLLPGSGSAQTSGSRNRTSTTRSKSGTKSTAKKKSTVRRKSKPKTRSKTRSTRRTQVTKKSTAAKKPAAKKPAAKKPAAKKPAAKKPTPKKPAA